MTTDPPPPLVSPLIAIVGPRQAGKRALISSLVSAADGTSDADAGANGPGLTAGAARPPRRQPWTIDTK
jgi:hypothetical protein